MASADELIREAQYAFRNIGHGSTDEKKYRARAKKYARNIIRKYPVSIEASQARSILDQLNVKIDTRAPVGVSPQQDAAADFENSHSLGSGHTGNDVSTTRAYTSQYQQTDDKEDWRGLIRRFVKLPNSKKKFLGIIVVFAILFPGGIFAVSGLVIFYALQPALLKKHLNFLLMKLEP